MGTKRLLAAGALGALLLCSAQPLFVRAVFAQAADDDASETDAAGSPAKPARKAAPKASKPAAPAKATAPSAAPPAATASGKPPITAPDVRPPANIMVDCAAAPKDAVTKLPDDLALWATVYCTKLGHIFNANDTHFGAFPDSGLRASFNAADMIGKDGATKSSQTGNDAYFNAIGYHQLSATERNELIAADPSVQRIYEGKSLWRLDLSAVGGASLSFIVIDPSADPFWVFPLGPKGIDKPAFYVTSLDALNKAR